METHLQEEFSEYRAHKTAKERALSRNKYHLREVIKLGKDTVLNGKFNLNLMKPGKFLLSTLNSLVEA